MRLAVSESRLGIEESLRSENADINMAIDPYNPRLGLRASCSPLKIQHFTPMAPKLVRASCRP
jgi:hypothetical protein